jgi:crossover junction endodeoxyribonuclease RuvC
MRILGLDPGYAILGWGVLDFNKGKFRPVAYGSVTTEAGEPMPARLGKLYASVMEIIAEYEPEVAAIEELFFNRNVTTAIPVGQARGVVLLAAAKNNIPIVERTPMQIKQDVTGYGKADKKQVIYMVTKLLHLPEPPKPDDTADALAVAICTTYCMGNAAFRNSIS